jgi:hypothetical protein
MHTPLTGKNARANTARCPICHRRAPVESGRFLPHESGSRPCTGANCFFPTRKPFEVAEAVVRDLRRQDDERCSDERASEALARWRTKAETAGDKVVVAALTLLHPDSAVSLYALPGVRGGARDIAETRALLRAAHLPVD